MITNNIFTVIGITIIAISTISMSIPFYAYGQVIILEEIPALASNNLSLDIKFANNTNTTLTNEQGLGPDGDEDEENEAHQQEDTENNVLHNDNENNGDEEDNNKEIELEQRITGKGCGGDASKVGYYIDDPNPKCYPIVDGKPDTTPPEGYAFCAALGCPYNPPDLSKD